MSLLRPDPSEFPGVRARLPDGDIIVFKAKHIIITVELIQSKENSPKGFLNVYNFTYYQ